MTRRRDAENRIPCPKKISPAPHRSVTTHTVSAVVSCYVLGRPARKFIAEQHSTKSLASYALIIFQARSAPFCHTTDTSDCLVQLPATLTLPAHVVH